MSTSTINGTPATVSGHYEVQVLHPQVPGVTFKPRFVNPATPINPGFANQAAYQAAAQVAATALIDAVVARVQAGQRDATYALMNLR